MAVDVISPDTRKKVDELFLYWLSEPSTQEMLRHELAKVCGLQHSASDMVSDRTCSSSSRTKLPYRPSSPNSVHTATSPTPPLSRSPKSPPVHAARHAAAAGRAKLQDGQETTDGSHPNATQEIKQESEVKRQLQVSGAAPGQNPPPLLPPPLAAGAGATLEAIPRFYFPNGRPNKNGSMDKQLEEIDAIFHRYPRHELPKKDFSQVLKVQCMLMDSISTYLHVFLSVDMYIW